MAAAEYKLADMRQDAADAFQVAERYHAELKEIYRYFMPWRLPTSDRTTAGQRQEGQRLGTEMLFDSTGISSAAAFVANMQADWMPHHEPLFKAEAGPLFPENETDTYNRRLEVYSRITHGLLGQTRVNALEMLQDLFAGTGAMFIEKGDRERSPIQSVAVPVLEMAMVNGPWGEIDRWFWKRIYKARHLARLWPDGKFGDRLSREIKDRPNNDVEVVQYTYWSADTKRFELRVWTKVDDSIIRSDSYEVTPWVTPRLFVVPGESFGRGFAHLGLPNAKSLNKARELDLRAAAFALLGLWIRRHDGVFNPDTAVMAPGRMWKVAHTSGNLKSIEKLDVPGNFNISTVVTKEEREQLRRVLLDDELPELADRVRSPTEIAGRMRRFDRNRGGNTVRLGQEMIVPLARRAMHICQEHGFFGQGVNLRLDQIGTQISIVSPAAVAARAAKVERVTNWLQIIIGLFGPQAALLAAEVEKAIPQLGRWMGVDEAFIRSKGGTAELKAMIAQYAAQLQASAEAKATQAKAQTEAGLAPGQQYVNGAL